MPMERNRQRTHVRHSAPLDADDRLNGQAPSYLQVTVYGTVAGALALAVGQTAGNAFFSQYSNAARTIVLAAIALLVGAAAGVVCDPILQSLNRRRGGSSS